MKMINYFQSVISQLINVLENYVLNSASDETKLNDYCRRLDEAYDIQKYLQKSSLITAALIQRLKYISNCLSPAEQDSIFVLNKIEPELVTALFQAANSGNKELADEAEGLQAFLELDPPLSMGAADKEILYRNFLLSSEEEIHKSILSEKNNLLPDNQHIKAYFTTIAFFGYYYITIA